MHAGVGALQYGRHDISITAATGDNLLALDATQVTDAVAQSGGTLELQCRRFLLHAPPKFLHQRIAFALQKLCGIADILRVIRW